MADRQSRFLALVIGSLAASTRKAYAQAWQEFTDSGAVKREVEEGLWRRSEDVIQFILKLIEKGQSRVTIAGKLAAIAFVGKLIWGYAPTAGEMSRRLMEGWSREVGQKGKKRSPLQWS